MIVVEDTASNEIRQFFVVDAMLQLGIVKAGTQVRVFDPGRALSYFAMVEDHLHDLATQYPGAFRYLPRRVYDYLKKPVILSELCASTLDPSMASWLVDMFFARPLIAVAGRSLPDSQQGRNSELTQRWSLALPYSPRLYHIQDMRNGRRSNPGWGCALTTADLQDIMRGMNGSDVLKYIKSGLPLFMELNTPDDTDALLRWLIGLRDTGLSSPNLFFAVRSHSTWGSKITQLLEIPNTRLLTCGATISSLTAIISDLRKNGQNSSWSTRLVFASAYPETHEGESISEILSYLFSRNLAASPEDLQRILGTNLLSILPPRPSFLSYVDNDDTVISEGQFGRLCLKELARVLMLLGTKGRQNILSVDHMLSNEGSVSASSAVVTLGESSAKAATSLAVLVERDGTLRVSGWKRTFAESLSSRKNDIYATLVRASTNSSGPVLDSPAHLNQFDLSVLKCLQVRNPQEILSGLHFAVDIRETKPGVMMISSDDMRALGVSDGETVLALEGGSGQWWSARAAEGDAALRRVMVSRPDAQLVGLDSSAAVDLVKYEGHVADLREMIFAYEAIDPWTSGELSSHIHLHEDSIKKTLAGRAFGFGTRLYLGEQGQRFTMNLVRTEPELSSGQLGEAPSEGLVFRPAEAFEEINVILCLLMDQSMAVKDVNLSTDASVRRRLSSLMDNMPDLTEFLSGLEAQITRAQLAALVSLLTISQMAVNRTEGHLGFVVVSEQAHKYCIQKGNSVQASAEFAEDLPSHEVMTSLLLSIFDAARDVGGRLNVSVAYRSIAELLEDFGKDRPTLVVLIGSKLGGQEEESAPFLKAISDHERYRLDLLGVGEGFDDREARRLLRSVNGSIVPVRSFSAQVFDDYLLSAIRKLLPR
ncbi:MAG: hypothetical protein C4K49_04250 [Candidatus Thorarchaeota archaeon]|nr:MAG: hypothetical protein C4K49_04250 [Candidatus Thorarchaeota archaeon]